MLDKIFAKKFMYSRNHLEVTLTSACAVMCSYCPQTKYIKAYKKLDRPTFVDRHSARFMTPDNFSKILDNVGRSVKVLYFTGYTEPLANPHWFDCVVMAIKRGYAVHLNSTLIGAKDVDIQNLLTLDIPLRIHLTDSNKKTDVNYYSILKEKYSGSLSFDYFTETGQALFAGVDASQGQITSRSENMSNIKAVELHSSVYCSEFRQYSNVVLPDGNVAVCCSDFGLRHIVGNLYDQSLDEIHNGEKLQNFIKKMLSDDDSFCNKCEYAQSLELGTFRKISLASKLIVKRLIS